MNYWDRLVPSSVGPSIPALAQDGWVQCFCSRCRGALVARSVRRLHERIQRELWAATEARQTDAEFGRSLSASILGLSRVSLDDENVPAPTPEPAITYTNQPNQLQLLHKETEAAFAALTSLNAAVDDIEMASLILDTKDLQFLVAPLPHAELPDVTLSPTSSRNLNFLAHEHQLWALEATLQSVDPCGMTVLEATKRVLLEKVEDIRHDLDQRKRAEWNLQKHRNTIASLKPRSVDTGAVSLPQSRWVGC